MAGLNNNSSQLLEAGDFNLARGRYDSAFDQYFEAFTQELCEEAQKRLTSMTLEGLLKPDQIERLFQYHNSFDSHRNGIASFNVGLMYEQGLGGAKQDLSVAAQYYEKAIEQGIPDAHANLGQILISGSGVPWGVQKNLSRGIALLEQGVERGSRHCAYTLGCMYKSGDLIPVDDRRAAYYLAIASLAKHEHAQRLLILLQQTARSNFEAEIGAARNQVDEWEFIRLNDQGFI
jgi:TPR repeat protein